MLFLTKVSRILTSTRIQLLIAVYLCGCLMYLATDYRSSQCANDMPCDNDFGILLDGAHVHNICRFGKPCVYPEEVDLRIIILTYNRPDSLQECLEHLQGVELDGDKAMLEIWIDRSVENVVNNATLWVAKRFVWKHGDVRVHVQEQHAGIYGQWINTWRPPVNPREIGFFIEDDVMMSPYFYRWLKKAHQMYGHRDNIGGYSLQEDNIKIAGYDVFPAIDLKVKSREVAYLYRVLGTWGFAPHPQRWRQFQDWFHGVYQDSLFHPYVEEAALQTGWYKIFESEHKEHTMWSIWFIYFTHQNNLWTLYANINRFGNRIAAALATSTRERGMHSSKPRRGAPRFLMRRWKDSYLQFPQEPIRYDYKGEEVQ